MAMRNPGSQPYVPLTHRPRSSGSPGSEMSLCEGLKLQAHIDSVQDLKSMGIHCAQKRTITKPQLIIMSIDFPKQRKILSMPEAVEKKIFQVRREN